MTQIIIEPGTVNNAVHSIRAEESQDPVELQRIDDEQGTVITLFRNFDGEGVEEPVFLVFTPENARKLGQLLLKLAG